MDSFAFQVLLQKLSTMAAATARVGAGAAAVAGGAGGSRGLRTAAAVGSVWAAQAGGQQQQQQQQQQQAHQQRLPPLQATSAAAAGYASSLPARPSQQQQSQAPPFRSFVNLAAAAAAPPPPYLATGAQLAGGQGSRSSLGPAPAPAQQQQRRRYTAAAATAGAQQLAASSPEDGSEYDGSDAVGAGSLLEFERGKEYLLGRAVKPLAQGWQVEVPSGTVYSVKHGDVKFVLPGGPGFSSVDLQSLAAGAARVTQEAGQEGLLQLAWELALDPTGGPPPIFTVPQMADFLFNRAEAPHCAAALRLLREDRIFFKQAGRSPPMFSPRSEADVRSLQASLDAAAQAEAVKARFIADIQAAQALPRPSKPDRAAWLAGPHAERLAGVEALALGDLLPSSADYAAAGSTLRDLGKLVATQDAAELLQSIGWWEPHLQLNLLSAGVSEQFRPELEAAAAELLASPPPDPDAGWRRDFTESATVFTIDDASTTEIDDGLSVERLPDGTTKVWVHIADPSRWVAPGTLLAAEACARSKSLYLPTGVVPMFPKSLAEGPFSLRQGVPTEAISVGACLSPDGALLAHSVEVVPSRVAPQRRLTYMDADEIFEECTEQEEPELFGLLELAVARRQHRVASGAVEIQMPESSVEVRDPHLEEPQVTISAEDQHRSPARQMVAEMMILAGEAVGELGRRLSVPLPYRGQAEPVLPTEEEMEAAPPGPCQAVLLRQRMTRSVTTTAAPVRHAGLGLEAYVQFTSPIRRYGDLLAHWQLKAALRGEQPAMDTSQLAAAVDECANATQRLSKLERETESYWVAEYFRQKASEWPRSAWGATFLCWMRQDVGLGRVLLDGLGLETVLRINSPVQPGEQLYVRCQHIDVRQGMWRLEVAAESTIEQQDFVC